jgi:hypothetical protein
MNLQELLDELRGNMLRDVSDALDTSSDKLWSDDTLVRYINDGYRRFCRRTLLIRDSSSPEFTQLTLAEGVDSYPLHKSVLAVITARIVGKDYDLHKTTHDSLAGAATNSDRALINGQYGQPGEPRWFSLDEEAKIFRVSPLVGPEYAGKLVTMRVARMPKANLTIDDLGAELEVDEDYHLDILEWAAYRALRNHDVDVENIGKANSHKNRFDAVVEEAIDDSRRSMFAPVEFVFNSRW